MELGVLKRKIVAVRRFIGPEVLVLNSEPQNRRIMNRRISKGGFALLKLFLK
jgi:hypothetical protein